MFEFVARVHRRGGVDGHERKCTDFLTAIKDLFSYFIHTHAVCKGLQLYTSGATKMYTPTYRSPSAVRIVTSQRSAVFTFKGYPVRYVTSTINHRCRTKFVYIQRISCPPYIYTHFANVTVLRHIHTPTAWWPFR